MKLLAIVVTAFLAAVGVFSLVNDLSEKTQKPQRWLKVSRPRRTLLIILLSVIIAPIRGTYVWLKSIERKKAIDFLSEIELKVAQIESLLNNIIASKESGASVELLDMLAEYLVTYGIRNSGTDDEGSIILTAPDWDTDLGPSNGRVVEDSLKDLKDAVSLWSELGEKRFDTEVLYQLLKVVDRTKTTVKRLLNEYTG